MAQCDACGTMILFGGVREGQRRYCNENCHLKGFLGAVGDQFPQGLLAKAVKEVHEWDCPKCGGPGPVDVHTSHTIWSAIVLTSFQSKPAVCCRNCGVKAMLGGLAFSGVLGWWGFPFGLIMTPVQIFRNLAGLVSAPDPFRPSAKLEDTIRLSIAANCVGSIHQPAGPD